MNRLSWSKLYPRKWREQFGDEFDELNSKRGMRLSDAADILFGAACVRFGDMVDLWPFAVAWTAVGVLNVCANEVQWAAGGLLVSAFCASVFRPQKWFYYSWFFFIVIPISSLYIYLDPSSKHAPLYQTSVALVPSMIGALLGRFSSIFARDLLRNHS